VKFSELITKLHSASQPHMLMYIDIRSDCELVDVNILASGQSDVQAGTLYFADAGQLTPDTVLPTNWSSNSTKPFRMKDIAIVAINESILSSVTIKPFSRPHSSPTSSSIHRCCICSATVRSWTGC
jgi:ribosomal silencing factor RsfS